MISGNISGLAVSVSTTICHSTSILINVLVWTKFCPGAARTTVFGTNKDNSMISLGHKVSCLCSSSADQLISHSHWLRAGEKL